MNASSSPSPSDAPVDGARLAAAIVACQRAITPSRTLDAQIALAVFPALIDLSIVEAGIWLQGSGTRVRALRYSQVPEAAATLVPAGHWIDVEGADVIVTGAEGAWAGAHRHAAISLCIAALSARLARVRHVH
ncbi:hypothetical protein EGO55_10565 [Caenibius tardaugens NBRC 16725]|nr:hypothetical protein EGO55_10565 [Caenibius tardaugens NBRC 16725]